MIRREIQLPDQPPQWLLISQVEHARLSGLLAERCLPRFGEALRTELLQAIIHHDDGWSAWEAQPQLDAEHRRPLSFRELPLAESLAIWGDSIAAVEQFGPLASWVVSGHFLALLKASEKLPTEPAVQWREVMIARRGQWLADWQAQNPQRYNRALADEALLWLQLLDVLSLWLCSVCPGDGESIGQTPEGYCAGAGQPFETEFSCELGHVRMKPWRLDVPSLSIEGAGWLVPVREYRDADDLLTARATYAIRWQLANA